MKSKNETLFRNSFDQLLTGEGFVWRYGTYIHVEFEQGWYLQIWPKVMGQGWVFELQFRMVFFNDQNSVNAIKKMQWVEGENMFKSFSFANPGENSWVEYFSTEEDYQFAKREYQEKVSKVLHRIKSPFDAYRFIMQYGLWIPDCVLFNYGLTLVDILLYIQHPEEIPDLLTKMKNECYRTDSSMELFLENSRHTYKDALPQSVLEHYHKRKATIKSRLQRIEEIEGDLVNTDLTEKIAKTKVIVEHNRDIVRRGFSKSEIARMKELW